MISQFGGGGGDTVYEGNSIVVQCRSTISHKISLINIRCLIPYCKIKISQYNIIYFILRYRVSELRYRKNDTKIS